MKLIFSNFLTLYFRLTLLIVFHYILSNMTTSRANIELCSGCGVNCIDYARLSDDGVLDRLLTKHGIIGERVNCIHFGRSLNSKQPIKFEPPMQRLIMKNVRYPQGPLLRSILLTRRRGTRQISDCSPGMFYVSYITQSCMRPYYTMWSHTLPMSLYGLSGWYLQ